MALSEAILVCLTEAPMTGYELARTFETSIGFFWQASHQQIYRELARLREQGLAESEEVAQSGKPNRIVHHLTAAGRERLRAWSVAASDPPAVKDPLLVKLYALDLIDREALIADLQRRLSLHGERLALYQRILHKRYEGRELDLRQSGKLMGLRSGLSFERHAIAWCEETLQALQALAQKPAEPPLQPASEVPPGRAG